MLKHVISQGDFAFWPQLSLVIFCVTFIAILAVTLRRGAKPHFEYMADLVLQDEKIRKEN